MISMIKYTNLSFNYLASKKFISKQNSIYKFCVWVDTIIPYKVIRIKNWFLFIWKKSINILFIKIEYKSELKYIFFH